MILMQRLVKVDGKYRTDTTYPAGFMDVITLEKTDDHFRCVDKVVAWRDTNAAGEKGLLTGATPAAGTATATVCPSH